MNDIQRAIMALRLEGGIEITGRPKRAAEFLWGLEVATSAMQELQQYRQIGASPERCKELICERSAAKRILAHYQAIGTLEECREARKRHEKKKPIAGADFMVGRDDDGEPIWETDYVCPECGCGIAGEYICCPYCGQAIGWKEE